MLNGTYGGTVEKVDDPEKLGRVKVRVPHVYGATGSGTGYVGTNDLPWALPAGMPAGGQALSGGFSMLPEPGDHVWVRFLDGEPEKPIWEWGMQTQDDAKSLPLHSYDRRDGQVGKPDATRWTRYGHLLEMTDGALLITTSHGYSASFLDSSEIGDDGRVELTTALRNFIALDDTDNSITISTNEDLYLTVLDEIIAQCRSLSLTVTDDATVEIGGGLDLTANLKIDLKTGADYSVDALGAVKFTSLGAMSFETPDEIALQFATLQLGSGASEPYVKGNQLAAFLNSLLVWLAAHVHGNGNEGTPTTPPLEPPTPIIQPEVPELLSEVITGI